MSKPEGVIKLRRRKIDLEEEKKLLINLIVSTEFCKEMIPRITPKTFHVQDSRIIFKWVHDYFQKYEKAPFRDIQDIYDKQPKRIKESTIISAYLENLSKKYEDYEDGEYNPEYEIDEAKEYIRKNDILITADEAKLLLSKGKIEKAEEILKGFAKKKTLSDTTDFQSSIQACILNTEDFIEADLPEPLAILSPWLTDGSITEIYAPRGIGKTWLALAIGVAVSREKAAGLKIGPWEVLAPSGVLYIDGEMGEYAMQERLRLLCEPLGKSHKKHPFDIITAGHFARKAGKQINLTVEEHRQAFYNHIEENDKYNLLIIDNVASLTPGIMENSKEDWDPINQWLLALRHLNVATIFIHHAGKSAGAGPRGTSGREDALDCVIELSHPQEQGYKSNQGCYFKIAFKKARNVPPGSALSPFYFQIGEDLETEGLIWKTSEAADLDNEQESMEYRKQVIRGLLLQNELRQKQIANVLDVSPPIVGKNKEAMERDGFIKSINNQNWTITREGKEELEKIQEDHDLEQYYELI